MQSLFSLFLPNTFCACFFSVDLTQVIWEEGTSIEKMLLLDRPIDKPAVHFLA